MSYSRLFAGISFFGFVFALGGTLRLAVAERVGPTASGNARDFEDLAERQPTLARSSLRAAVRLNPRDSAAWMALGLAAERDGDMEQAADNLLEAEKVDRQYLPAWTSANFFFRRANDPQFWRAAARAAAMSNDEVAPLIELADHREPKAIAALERLEDSPRMKRGYLRFLIAQSRWPEAEDVAARLSASGAATHDASDRELLLNFTDHLIAADEGEAALAAWNGLQQFPAPDRVSHGMLVNGIFQMQPSGHGFDWRVTESPLGSVHWRPSKLEFRLTEATPDACTLLAQWVVLEPGRYRLRFEHRSEGLAEETGLRWALLRGGQVEASSSALAKAADWDFQVGKAGLYDLAWIYGRVPGTIHRAGVLELSFVRLEKQ